MMLFQIGELVKMAVNPEIVFKIVQINKDLTYQIQIQCRSSQDLNYDHVPAEMLRRVED